MQADDLPDGLVIADHEGRITVFNRAAGRLTGIDPGSALGGDVRDVLALRDVEGNCWWSQTRPYGGLSTRTRHPERSLYLADGTELLVSVGYVRDWHAGAQPGGDGPGGDEPGAVRRLAITLRDAQQRARAERSRADLVSTVAHELRSPLTSVKGFTATLLNKWPRFTDDQKLVMLETVNADADRVTRLITELLDVSRIESGRIEVHRELVDIPELARKVIAGRVAVGEPEDKFRLEAGAGLPETWLDADKVVPDPGEPYRERGPARGWYGYRRGGVGPGRRALLASRCPCATRGRASRPSSPRGCSGSSGGSSAAAARASACSS